MQSLFLEAESKFFQILLQSQGGIYENEPDSLLGIARHEKEDDAHLVVTTSAAERKNAFLKKAAEESKVKRLDPKVRIPLFYQC